MPKITKSSTKQSKSITSNLSLHNHEQPQSLHTFKFNQQLKYQNNTSLCQDNMIHNQIQHKTKNQSQNQQDSDRNTHFELEYMKKEVVFGGGGSWGGS